MKKQIFVVPGGLQRINQNIENESYASLKIETSEAPENVADGSFAYTSLWNTNLDSMVERLNEEYAEKGIEFSVSGFDDELILDINA